MLFVKYYDQGSEHGVVIGVDAVLTVYSVGDKFAFAWFGDLVLVDERVFADGVGELTHVEMMSAYRDIAARG